MVEKESAQAIRTRIADNLILVYKPITFIDTKEIFVWDAENLIYVPGEHILQSQTQESLEDNTSNHDISEIISIIQRKTYKNRKEIELNNLNLIPLQNGLYDLETDRLMDYSPEHFIFFKHPIAYNSIAQCPKIDTFLDDITENSMDKREKLLKLAGYCFYRSQKYQKAFMLLGKGSNGKTVYLNLITEIIGKTQTTNMELQEIMENKFAPGRLYHKNMNIYDDLQARALKNTGKFKALTGEGQLDCDRKFKEQFKFDNVAKLIFACNKLPKTPDTTDAFYRRWEIIKFGKQFRDDQKDVNLLEKLCEEEELSGFFNLAMNGLRTLFAEGYSDEIEKTKEMYEKHSDISKAFCYDCLELNLDDCTKKELIWQEYNVYCKENDTPPDSEKAFYQTIYNFFDGKAYSSRRLLFGEIDRTWVIVGIKVKSKTIESM